MPEINPLKTLPTSDGPVPDLTLEGPVLDCEGVLVSQNGENLHQILLDLFPGPTPQQGSVRLELDAKGARQIADHLYHLANYAELGVEAVRLEGR